MRVYVTGINGQLGRALTVEIGGDLVGGCDLPELDIADRAAIAASIRASAPDVVIHAAAWTDVDGCAREPVKAFGVNALGTQHVALACADVDAALVYVSTNEVFDGYADEPYREWDSPHPINPYGASKAAGEWYVSHLLSRFYIVRTAWLFAPGGRNFPHRIIEAAEEVRSGLRSGLRVVDDEISNPTLATDVAEAIAQLITTGAYGVYHLVSEGFCSRYDLARHVLDLAGFKDIGIEPIKSADFERPSTPPSFAPLANTAGAGLGIRLPRWQDAVCRLITPSD